MVNELLPFAPLTPDARNPPVHQINHYAGMLGLAEGIEINDNITWSSIILRYFFEIVILQHPKKGFVGRVDSRTPTSKCQPMTVVYGRLVPCLSRERFLKPFQVVRQLCQFKGRKLPTLQVVDRRVCARPKFDAAVRPGPGWWQDNAH